MKTLANCKPSEFLKQTVRIKKNVEKWLTSDDIKEIRDRLPELKTISESMTKEEQGKVLLENRQKMKEQGYKNFMDILEVMMDKKADETLAVLALCCFVEPENVDDHTMGEYFDAMSDLLEDSSVIRFFVSLARLAQTDISTASKK